MRFVVDSHDIQTSTYICDALQNCVLDRHLCGDYCASLVYLLFC